MDELVDGWIKYGLMDVWKIDGQMDGRWMDQRYEDGSKI